MIKKWTYNRFENKEYNYIDEIKNVKINKKGKVVAIIDSMRQNNNTERRYISIGDKVGEKLVWKNTFTPVSYEKPNIIAIDDESGCVAVFGQINKDESGGGKKVLLIDDIPYEISSNPEKLEYMDFKDGSLVIQYKNVLGEKITEKISLREDSKAVQETKEKMEVEEKNFENLRRFLINESIPINEVITRLKKGGVLDKEIERNQNLNLKIISLEKDLNSKIVSLEEEKIKLQLQIKNHEQEMKIIKIRNTNDEITLKKLENIFKKANKAIIGSNFKLSSEDMKLALNLIQDTLEKNK